MIPAPPLDASNEPKEFDGNCRQCGNAWLREYPHNDPHEKSQWWSQFRPNLAEHFSYRCGWQGTWIGLEGVVDHYLSCGNRQGRPSPDRNLAFEWSNYRYALETVNSFKGTLDRRILDPCEVGDGWFKVLIHRGFQLVATDRVPAPLRDRAEFTLKKLQLRKHAARWTRWSWYKMNWNNGSPNLATLSQVAPLVAEAVRQALTAGEPLPDPGACEPYHAIQKRKRAYRPRKRSSVSVMYLPELVCFPLL